MPVILKGTIQKRTALECALVFAVFLGLCFRLAGLFSANLWTDEVWSAALSKETLVHIVGLTLRYDSHPPLYYLQLHLWQLLSENDAWLLTNSLLYSIASAISLFFVLRSLYGRAEACVGLAVLSVTPLAVVFAETLRMYALENLLAVWMFYVAERIVRFDPRRTRHSVIFVILGSAINLLHGFGAMVTFFICIYTFVRAFQERLSGRVFRRLLIVGFAVGLSTSYSVVVGSMRQTIGLSTPDSLSILSELTISLMGFNIPAPQFASLIFIFPFIGLCLSDYRSRTVIWWLFIAPTLLMIWISVSFKPVYTFRATGLFLPFLAVGFAIFACRRKVRIEIPTDVQPTATLDRAVVVTFLMVLSVTSLYNTATYRKASFERISTFWAARSLPGDAVYVNSFESDYLGFVRYLPGVVKPMVHEVEAPPPLHWQKIFAHLGPVWVRRLDLLPDTDHLVYNNRFIYPSFDRLSVMNRFRFWILQTKGQMCELPDYRTTIVEADGPYSIVLCESIATNLAQKHRISNSLAPD